MSAGPITIRQIECFLEIARRGSTQGAAEALNITQSAASRRLGELEASLGTQLFTRAGRRLLLNDQGLAFQRHAAAAARALHQARSSVTRATADIGFVRIGAMPSVAGALLPEIVRLLQSSGHKSKIVVETGVSSALLAMLRSGDIDLLVGRMPPPDRLRGLHFEHMYYDTLAFVASSRHPLGTKGAVTPESVLQFPSILPPRDAVIRPLAESYFAALGLPWPDSGIETTSVAFCTRYLQATDAVWLISRGVAANLAERGVLAFLNTDMSATKGSVGVVTRAGEDMSAFVTRVIDTVKRHAATL